MEQPLSWSHGFNHEPAAAIKRGGQSETLGEAAETTCAVGFGGASRSRPGQFSSHAHFIGDAAVGTLAKEFNTWPTQYLSPTQNASARTGSRQQTRRQRPEGSTDNSRPPRRPGRGSLRPQVIRKNQFHIRRTFIRSLAKWMLVLCAIIFLYVLSLGPSYRALRKHRMKQSTFTAIYEPIVRYADADHPRFDDALYSYVSLWYDEGEEILNSIKAQLASNGIYTVEETSNRLRSNGIIRYEKPPKK